MSHEALQIPREGVFPLLKPLVGFRAEILARLERHPYERNVFLMLKFRPGNADLSDFIGTAWYASATWLVTGEDKDSDVQPRRPLFKGGFGAIEIGVRYDELTFESAGKTGPDFTNPRSEHLTPNSDRTVTFGVNWLANRWVKVVANALRQQFEDDARTPLAGTTSFWTGLLRLQVVF